MRSIPAVLVSRDGGRAIEVTQFEGVDRIPNRDAFGYYFSVRLEPDAEESRLVVIFSGTVYGVKPEAFGLPHLPDREATYVQFALAAIGDFLDDEGSPAFTPGGVSAFPIECFSPHFQSWNDRDRADDDVIIVYIRSHLYWAWVFNRPSLDLGMPDVLRLRQPVSRIDKLVRLFEDADWEVASRDDNRLDLVPSSQFLRAARSQEKPDFTSPAPEALMVDPKDDLELPDHLAPPAYVYVDEVRTTDLRAIENGKFDLEKLVALCEELNVCYRSQCYHAVAALTRAVMDHVPPIFGCKSFIEVANNYEGSRSFKETMQRLDEAARKIADGHLHTQIRSSETVPNRTQVNFSNELDVLLGEVVRLLKER